MKQFLRALGLRAIDLFHARGLRPYNYAFNDPVGGRRNAWTYSLGEALLKTDVDPATTAPGSKAGTKYVLFCNQGQHELRQDRFGRVHLPNAIKHRLFSK